MHSGISLSVNRCSIHTNIATPEPKVPIVTEYLEPGYQSMLGLENLIAGNPHAEQLLTQDQAIAFLTDARPGMISDILDFSKIESGKLELKDDPFDPRACVEGALDLLAHQASEQKLELADLVPPQTPEILVGDVTRDRQIFQLLVNLLSDTLKFTNAGKFVVPATAEELKVDRLEAQKVRKSKAQARNLQAVNSPTRHLQPTTQTSIEQSRLFHILDRLLIEQPMQASSTPSQVEPVDLDLAKRLPLRILLAEDNLVNQKVALRMLQRLGYRADPVGNGLEVLAALRRQPYDVVLMDVQMPEMDGLCATEQICQEWPGASCPWILAMTANARQSDREACLKAGMDDYISKPIQFPALVQALNKCQPLPRTPKIPAVEVLTQPLADDAIDPKALQSLQELVGKDTAVMVEVLDSYLEDAPQLVQAIRTAADIGDASGLHYAAHTLKSSSGTLGAKRLCQLSHALESISKGGTTTAALALVAQLEAEYKRVEATLQVERQRYQRYQG